MTTPDATGADSRYRHWPDLQFWYGLTFSELGTMPGVVRQMYERALPRLRAEAKAAAIDAAAFPHLKTEAQKKVIRRIERLTTPPERPLSQADRAKRAAQAGVAMVEVGPDGKPK